MSKPTDRSLTIRSAIHTSIKSLQQSLSLSFGPRGTDKLILSNPNSNTKSTTLITNDGSTILSSLSFHNPIMTVFLNLSKQQDMNCGDGTTSVVILANSLLMKCYDLIQIGITVSDIVEVLDFLGKFCGDVVDEMKIFVGDERINRKVKKDNVKIILDDSKCSNDKKLFMSRCMNQDDMMLYRESLLKSVDTALSSKFVSVSSLEFSSVAVDSVIYVKGNLNNIKIVKKVGGSVEDIYFSKSIILQNNILNPEIYKSSNFNFNTNINSNSNLSLNLNSNNNLTVLKKELNVAILQFCLSPPKPNLDFKIQINEASQIENIIKEERKYILDLVKHIKKSKVDLILIQKSILRDSLNDLAKYFLTSLKIMVINDIERKDISYISEKLNLQPSVDKEFINVKKVLVEEKEVDGVVLTELYCENACSCVVKGSDQVVVDEGERSLNDALCVVKCLVDDPYVVPGGGCVEMAIACKLEEESLNVDIFENKQKKNEKKVIGDENTDLIPEKSTENESNSKENVKKLCSKFENKQNETNSNKNKKISKQENKKRTKTNYTKSYIINEISKAFEEIPYFLSRNGGLNSTEMVNKMKNMIMKKEGNKRSWGINTRKNDISCMVEENVVQPAKVSKSVVQLAIETVSMIVKVDDMLPSKR